MPLREFFQIRPCPPKACTRKMRAASAVKFAKVDRSEAFGITFHSEIPIKYGEGSKWKGAFPDRDGAEVYKCSQFSLIISTLLPDFDLFLEKLLIRIFFPKNFRIRLIPILRRKVLTRSLRFKVFSNVLWL